MFSSGENRKRNKCLIQNDPVERLRDPAEVVIPRGLTGDWDWSVRVCVGGISCVIRLNGGFERLMHSSTVAYVIFCLKIYFAAVERVTCFRLVLLDDVNIGMRSI